MPSKLVCTTMGNSIVGSDNEVYVHVSGDRFVKKDAKDINVGDQVLFRKEFVSTTIEDVDKVLDRSLRYRHSKEVLHERSKKGELIPKQRTFLIRGLAQQSTLSSDEDLETKILKEKPDFTSQEYEAMREEVFALINPNYIPGQEEETRDRSRAAIDSWLRGKTIAIRMGEDWDLYRRLDPLNSDFRNFDRRDKSKEGYYYNYRLLVITRQTIQRYLAECKGAEKPSSKSSSREERISIAPEIQLVVNHFMEDIDEQYVAARVTDVDDFVESDRKKGKGKEKADPRLSAGVVTNKTSSENVEEIDTIQLLGEYYVLIQYSQNVLVNTILDFMESEGYSKDEANRSVGFLLAYFHELYDESGKISGSPDQSEVKRMGLEGLISKDSLEKIRRHIFEEESIDKKNLWKPGTFSRLSAATYKVYWALPRKFYLQQKQKRISRTNHQLDRHQLPKEEHNIKIQELEKELTKDYKIRFLNHQPIYPRYFLNNFLFDKKLLKILFETNPSLKKTFYGFRDVQDKLGRIEEMKETFFQQIQNSKEFFADKIYQRELEGEIQVYSRKEIKEILEKHDLGEILDYNSKEFILDELLEEKRKHDSTNSEHKDEKSSTKIEQKIQQEQKQRKKHKPKFTREATVRHRKILDYITQHSDVIEPNLELITDEYRFPTGDSADLVFKDSEGKFLTIEVEYIASGKGGLAGLEQAVKYKPMFIVDQRLEPENTVRGMLVAVDISDEIKLLCEKYGIEYKEVNIPEEAIFVNKNVYQTISGKEISLPNLNPKESQVYKRLQKFNGQGDFTKYYETVVKEVFNHPSKNKLGRIMERLQDSPLHKIYLDMKEKQQSD